MSEVRYSVNGKFFKDYGIYVSDSDGLFDALKRKKVNTSDWAEYNGTSPDLSNPKFEAREISLKCFVIGDSWLIMKENFDSIIAEFHKEETQRLLIECFGLKPLIYQITIIDEVRLDKKFHEGKMVGVFTLKLIEPNPIKKVYSRLKIDNNLQDDNYFKFYTPTWATIFWGDSQDYVRGNVDINRNYLLAPEKDRLKVDYNIWGIFHKMTVYSPNTYHFFTKAKFTLPGIKTMYLIGKHPDKTYSILAEIDVNVGAGFSSFDIPFNCIPTDYERFFLKMSEECEMKDSSVYTTDWVSTASDGYIVIAGNINEFSPVITNTTVIWEEL